MDEFFLDIFSYLYFILVGGVLGLAALMPAARTLARQKRQWRIGLAAFLGGLAFLVTFLIMNQAAADLWHALGNLLRGLIAGAACAGTVWLLTRSGRKGTQK